MRKTFLSLIFITSFLVCVFTHTVANTYIACDNDSINKDSTNFSDTAISIPNTVVTEHAEKKLDPSGIIVILKNGVCYDLLGRTRTMNYIWEW